MAAKSKAAPSAAKKAAPKRKAAPKKKAPAKSEAAKAAEREAIEDVHVEFVRDDEGHGALVLSVDGSDYTLNEQALLNLRREINDVAAGFVH